MRTDLDSMGSGRAAAQASHATSAFTKSFGPNSKCPRQEVKDLDTLLGMIPWDKKLDPIRKLISESKTK